MYSNFTIRIETSSKPYREFLKDYHYLSSLPKSNYNFGLYVDNELLGVACYGHPTAARIPKGTIELKRFCLSEKRLPNTGSWFMAKCERLLKQDPNITDIISYCDPANGHTGTLYKAANFKLKGKQKQGTPYYKVGRKKVYTRNHPELKGNVVVFRMKPKLIFTKKIA